MNVSSPWSRRRWTHPASVTSDPASAARSSPQVFVRSTYLIPLVAQVRRFAGGAWLMLVHVFRRALVERGLRTPRHVSSHLRDDGRQARHTLRLRDKVADDDVPAAR